MSDGYNGKRKLQEIIFEFIQRYTYIAILSETKNEGSEIENINDFVYLYTRVAKYERA